MKLEGFDIDDYINNLDWSDDATDLQKTLVSGNLRSLYYRLIEFDSAETHHEPTETE